MDPLIRQTSLETLLSHTADLTEPQLHEALKLGLSDPDTQINEIAWVYVRDQEKIGSFRGELLALAMKFSQDESRYFQKLANELLAAVEKNKPSLR